jgi:hypothetical protein
VFVFASNMVSAVIIDTFDGAGGEVENVLLRKTGKQAVLAVGQGGQRAAVLRCALVEAAEEETHDSRPDTTAHSGDLMGVPRPSHGAYRTSTGVLHCSIPILHGF